MKILCFYTKWSGFDALSHSKIFTQCHLPLSPQHRCGYNACATWLCRNLCFCLLLNCLIKWTVVICDKSTATDKGPNSGYPRAKQKSCRIDTKTTAPYNQWSSFQPLLSVHSGKCSVFTLKLIYKNESTNMHNSWFIAEMDESVYLAVGVRTFAPWNETTLVNLITRMLNVQTQWLAPIKGLRFEFSIGTHCSPLLQWSFHS